MDTTQAKNFAEEWIKSWNDHDIEAILSHYADELEFYSPFIPLLKFNDSGKISSKSELRRYFEAGLANYPDLYFEFHTYFTGINTVVIYYTSVNGKQASEVFELNAQGFAVKVYCNYSDAQNG